ncbi:N-acetylglucosamine kinase-like BadF-type ATPase [Allocatelliglobosispora scoriae]|uniref:N-acetylglucosamine kinase-like BadF-type ATPase n=1 Tax=Allocatelliglobosispora scoriae TaxID=643052 RepID=A0A841BTH8_9ACTN|nr:BadF/BadG/BcrA/BcrD ATPase family protein [Allocatelliglobosispora scoriae]MBB5870223.1 N-acetylglucosamine kinase-like BadF-type ATPase [Allocatelliglobosispora scoriae]
MSIEGIVVGVDGGNSKTDVVLADTTGRVLARTRGPASSPHIIGVPAAMELIGGLVARAKSEAGLAADLVLDRTEIYLAGADLPIEVQILTDAVTAKGWARENRVDNDTFALMRAGTDAVRAIAVVCGAGINCVGRDETGRTARFPALGQLTGDWGGGHHLATLALWHAARGEDGRGPATKLVDAVIDHFGVDSVEALGIAVHLGEIDADRINELTPVLFTVADIGDPIALRVVSKQANEVIALASVAADRLDMREQDLSVVLGGGVLAARHPILHEAIVSGITAVMPLAEVTVLAQAPVTGAVLFGLDALGAGSAAKARLRTAL